MYPPLGSSRSLANSNRVIPKLMKNVTNIHFSTASLLEGLNINKLTKNIISAGRKKLVNNSESTRFLTFLLFFNIISRCIESHHKKKLTELAYKFKSSYLNMSALLVKRPCINSGARYLGSPSRACVVSH